jgi:hypothetical protein
MIFFLSALAAAGFNVFLTGVGLRLASLFPRAGGWIQAVGIGVHGGLIFGAAFFFWRRGAGAGSLAAFIVLTAVFQTAGQAFLVLNGKKDQKN